MMPPKPSGKLVPRHMTARIQDALKDTRVVVVTGARQAGKSTVARQVLARIPRAKAVTLDDEPMLAAAREDPISFISHDGTLLIDEVQRAPELFLAIKAAVDRANRPGQFLLTGSAQVLALPKLADALVGRMEIVELWPFSQGEIRKRRERFVDYLLAGEEDAATSESLAKRDYLEIAVTGGFPEAVSRSTSRRARWFDSYISTLLQRDVKDLAAVERSADLRRLTRLVAARTATVLNVESMARDAGIPPSTMRRYLTLLETTYFAVTIPAWSNNKTSRVVRSPKLVVVDSGLAAHLLGETASRLAEPTGNAGQILETFVIQEVTRQAGWSKLSAGVYHLRTKEHLEVDIVLETPDGRVAGIETKATATVRASDFAGLRYLAAKAGNRFVGGVVLYAGTEPLSFGGGLRALPISALWKIAG